MFEKKSPEILVVGGGPVGLVAAACLSEHDVRVDVLEKQWGPATRSYALALHHRSLEILGELDALEPLLASAHRIETIGLYDASGLRARLDLGEVFGEGGRLAVLPQAELERLLTGNLEKRAGCRIRWNHRLRRLEPDKAGPEVEVERLGKDSIGYSAASTGWVVDKIHHWTPRFVVGADGHASTVRRDLGMTFETSGDRETFGVFECTGPGSGEDRELKIVFSADGSDVFWPMGGDRFRWSFRLDPEAERGAPERHGKSRLMVGIGLEAYPHLAAARVHDLIERRAPWWTGEVAEVDWSARLQFDRRLAESFGRRGAWLAGDAAHLDGPIGVRSMNAGFEEVRELAERMARELEGGDGELEAWGRDRLEQWRSGAGTGRSGAALADASDPWVVEHRERIAATLPAFGPDLDRMLEALAGAR